MATINPSNQQISQYSIQTGGASNLLNNVAPSATSGVPVISQGASAQPVFGTAVVAGGGTGQTTLTNHGVLVGAGTSAITQLSVGNSGTVLVGSTNADPSFTAYPQITGLGIGASPGGSSGLTFDGSNFITAFSNGTWTPTLTGGSTAGTTTYSVQSGAYTIIGNMIFLHGNIVITGATGTGNAVIGNFPYALATADANYNVPGTLTLSGTGWTFPTGITSIVLVGLANTTTGLLYGSGSTKTAAAIQMANAACTLYFSIVYRMS